MYELLHDLISRRQAPEQLEPLEVVLDGETPELYSLSNRRTWALLSFQASCRHEAVKVPCKLFCPTDPAVAQRYAARDTTAKLGWGLGLLLHGKNGTQEAWHLGEPLFRRATEWCENEAIHNQHNSVVEQVRPANAVPEVCIQENSTKDENTFGFASSSQMPEPAAPSWAKETQVCCRWLVGRCRWNQSHWVNQYYHLHEDVPGMQCGFGYACRYKHYEYRMAVTEGMLVRAEVSWSKCFAEVIEVDEKRSNPVKVSYIHSGKNDEWLDLASLKVPVYSRLEEGMQVTVDFHGERILCTVQQVKKDTCKAPVHVVGTGRQYGKEDWVGADRLQSTALTYVAPALCISRKGNQHLDSLPVQKPTDPCVPNEASLNQAADEFPHEEGLSKKCGQQGTSIAWKAVGTCKAATSVESAAAVTEMEAGWVEPTEGWGAKTAVCCLWLENKCWNRHSHWSGTHWYLHEDVPGMQCGFGYACRYKHYEYRMAVTEGMLVRAEVSWSKCFAEVIEVDEKRSNPVKVSYIHSGKNDEWLDLASLKVPVYSRLEEGMQVTVDFHGERILCTVQQVKKDTCKAPVHVVGTGRQYGKEDWVGADRLQSTALTYVAPALCISRKDNQHLDSLPVQKPTDACVPNEASLNQAADEFPHEEGLSKECRVNESDRTQNTSALCLQELPRHVEDTNGHVLPWTAEESSDDECHDGADHLLFAEHAVELLRLGNQPSSNAADKLQEASQSDLVRQILEEHSWTGGNFAQAPNTNVLLAQLKEARSKLDDCISISSQQSEPGALEDLNEFDGYSE